MATGRVYVVLFEGISVSAAQDLLEVQAPADAVVRLLRAWATQEDKTTNEQLEVAIKRGEGSVTSGSGGSSVTPTPVSKGSPAFGGTCERNNTTKLAAGTGTIKYLHREGWGFLAPFDYRPAEGEEPDVSPSDYIAMELVSAPAGATVMSGGMIIEEIGG